jgi:hypothetical protein
MRQLVETLVSKRLLMLLSSLAVVTSGCVTIGSETEINADGSGTKSFVLALDRSVISMLQSTTGESEFDADALWSDLRTSAASIQGSTVEQYSDEEAEGVKVSIPFDSAEDLETLSTNDSFEGAEVVTIDREGDTIVLKTRVRLADVTSSLNEARSQGLEYIDLGDIQLEYSYTLKVEGEIMEYSPQEFATVEGNKVTWNLSQTNADTIELMLRWKPADGIDPPAILLATVAVGGLGLIVFGTILALRGRQTALD